ncbi:MAG: ABC transporter ATP-binding protein [Bryobacteraceae bacterium]|nr:ABC transporter ATP-binding protein [Bryobacteraceae bacterium]
MIQIRELSKVYGQGPAAFRALDKADLDIHPSQVTLLMGPSGSGKTTLVSIMGCILRATSGSVKFEGRELANLKEHELPKVRLDNFGFVFQGFNLFPALTARENVEVALGLKGVRGATAHRRAGELLEQVGLASKTASFPADLSGGQKQRVAIARALAGEPRVILADEPTAALDSSSGQLVMETLAGLARDKGRAVVIVTHDSRVLGYADRIVELEDGRIVRDFVPSKELAAAH